MQEFGCIGDFAVEYSSAARASGTFSNHNLVHRPYQVSPRNQYYPPGGVEAGCIITVAVQCRLSWLSHNLQFQAFERCRDNTNLLRAEV
jgi:hypothetical protein